jgi:hypothetical protein
MLSGKKLSDTRYSDTQTKVRITELKGCVAQSQSAHDLTMRPATGVSSGLGSLLAAARAGVSVMGSLYLMGVTHR